ncbi:MAG: pyridoxamine 5'-phosphate oxidase family protein [Candidatus Omnitrophota bacterium]
MDLHEYFEKTKGTGVLATADNSGKVDAALYARPHMLQDGTLAFIMADRLTHHNLQSNPQAAYLFIETQGMYQGKRLFLKKVSEEKNSERIKTMRHSCLCNEEKESDGKDRYLVIFKIEKELPLVGP